MRAAALTVVVGALAFALLASGCGGPSGGQGSQDGSSRAKAAAAYSACMRKNGVPDFPDPDSNGHLNIEGGRLANGQKVGLDVDSPQFKAAQKACQRLLPNGDKLSPQEQAKDQQAALKFSRCMRSHGVPKFPDPQFTSDGGSLLRVGKDLNPDSPRFKAAQRACQELVPGSAQ